MRQKTFDTYHTEAAAYEDMKRRRKRKFSVTYSARWDCWVAWYNA